MPPATKPVRPAKAPSDGPKLVFRRGRRSPRAIAWFGARSFWGHLWHLGASVVATEDIDSRDWMTPDEPLALTRRIAAELGGRADAETLTEALGDDLYVDFIADTGDDSSVSQAVAKILFEQYEVDDPDSPGSPLLLPRGKVLIFGGDTAYPVATELEINNRVIVPFHRVLKKRDDGERRVLLGIPGNHDWYAGLDGFGRMFRRRRGSLDRATRGGVEPQNVAYGNIRHFFKWMEAFRVGRLVVKRPTLPLLGYVPVQAASYFALRLAPSLDLFAPDRQLRAVDFHQQLFFAEAREGEPARGIVLMQADPAWAFLEPSAAGQDVLRSLDLDIEREKLLLLTGDTHHYCRQRFGDGFHVTAGGGGAFLHPAPIMRVGLPEPEAEFPGRLATLSIALQIPVQIAHGRAGFLVHGALAALYVPSFAVELAAGEAAQKTAIVTGVIAAVVCLLIGGWRTAKALRVALLSVLAGALLGFLPILTGWAEGPLAHLTGITPHGAWAILLPYATTVYAAAWVVGAFFMMLTLLGLESHQAFGAMAHPGFKHFVRLRVRKDGSRVDAFVLGKIDPLHRESEVVLVDQFTWTNPHAQAAQAPSSERIAPADAKEREPA